MKVFLLLTALVAVILGLLLFCPLRIDVEYRDKKIKITFRCTFLKYTIKSPKIVAKDKKTGNDSNADVPNPQTKEEVAHKSFAGAKEALKVIVELMKNKAKFSEMYLRLRYGVGDAAYTGILYGGIWALIGNLYAYLCRYFYIEFPKVELEPVFDQRMFEAEARGIITTRLVHIMIAGLRSLKVYKKYNKEKGAV